MKLDYQELENALIEYKGKSEYKQAAIIMVRNIFKEAEAEQLFLHGVGVTLKDKDIMTFEEWLEDHNMTQTYDWLNKRGMTDSSDKLYREWELTINPNL